MIDFICNVAIVVFSFISGFVITLAVICALYIAKNGWASGMAGLMVVINTAFYWILDTVMGKHTCQKGKEDGSGKR